VIVLSALNLYLRGLETRTTTGEGQISGLSIEDDDAHRHLNELRHIAFHDSLTGLPNRRRLHDRLQDALQRANAGRGHEFSLLFLDFDHFKAINDTLGHRAGDEFLARTSQLLQRQLRPQDLVARLGGDEFAILVQGSGCAEYAVSLADRMLKLLSQPMLIDGVSVNATASIGITSSHFGYADPAEVLRDADIAMYSAKSAGKARYVLFDLGMQRQVTARQPQGSASGDALRRDGVHRPQCVSPNIAAA
jgi:diguanylate cyclase (GGDEF)-like protein